ncbi:hypothetical protein JCM11641_000232 [Rhodosporidiobolus odoratus]
MLTDLPLELLPQLLAPLVNRRDLYNVSLVCREWRDIGQRLLYRRIRLFGKDLSITRMLFETLADTPRLAKMVRNLEVRVYPLSLILKERLETEQLAIRMLKNCVNSEELVWTRKGSLTDGVFEAITSLPYLRSFELNAHTNLSPGSWDADHFLRLRPLRSLSLILPDRNVASMLPSFFEQQTKLASHSTAGTDGGERLLLEELSVLCRESTVINDKVVASLVPALSGGHLRSLALAGCAKLTATPLLDLLPHLPNLRNLALEACNIDPSFFLLAAPSLTQLHSLKLTHPGPHHPTLSAFFPSLETLLSQTTSLTAFTLYHSGASSSGSREWPRLPEHFVHRLTATVGPRLRKFEVSGILVSVDSIEMLAGGAQELRNLVLHLEQEFELPRLVAAFVPLSSLRTLHLLSQRADVSPDDVLELAEQCSPTLRQVGFRNRVWVVKRSFSPSLDSQEDAPRLPKVSLGTYDLPWWPEALLVIRFLETAAAFGAFRRNRYGAESDVETEVEEGSDSDGEESSGSEGVVGGHSE